MSNTSFSSTTVHKIAQLAQIPVTSAEEKKLATAFNETLEVVEHMTQLDTSKTKPTYQVTGLENVLRDDVVDEKRMFSQEQALSNASQTHAGYFVVNQVIDQD